MTGQVDDELRVPFWIVLAGVGAGAFWALAGVAVGSWLTGRRADRHPGRRTARRPGGGSRGRSGRRTMVG